jgi:hypothetical protein
MESSRRDLHLTDAGPCLNEVVNLPTSWTHTEARLKGPQALEMRLFLSEINIIPFLVFLLYAFAVPVNDCHS